MRERKSLAALAICLGTIGFGLGGCWPRTEKVYNYGPSEGAEVVVVFHEETTHKGIEEYDKRLQIPETDGRKGYRLPDGISGVILVKVAGRKGYAIYLRDYATLAQRRDVLHRVVDHPLVEVVLTDTSADEATQQYVENGGWVDHVYYRGEVATEGSADQDQEPGH